MINSEYSRNNCKSLKISIGAIRKYPEKLRFIPDYLNTKKMCKDVVKKWPFIIIYVSD